MDRADVGRDLAVTYHKLARLRFAQNRDNDAKAYLIECRSILFDLMQRGVAFDEGMQRLWAALKGSRSGRPIK